MVAGVAGGAGQAGSSIMGQGLWRLGGSSSLIYEQLK